MIQDSAANRKRNRGMSPLINNDEEVERPVAQSVGLLVLIPIVVLLITAIVMWRPLLLAWAGIFWDLLFEMVLCAPFVAMCISRVNRTEDQLSLKTIAKSLWLALVWILWILFLTWPMVWLFKLGQYWPVLLYFAPLLFYAPRENQNRREEPSPLPLTQQTTHVLPTSTTNASPKLNTLLPCQEKKNQEIQKAQANLMSTATSSLEKSSAQQPLLVPTAERKHWFRRNVHTIRRSLEFLFWYAPQEVAAQTSIHLFGLRTYEPLAYIIDARLAIGSTPLTKNDLSILHTKFRVSALLQVETSEIRIPCFRLLADSVISDFEPFDIATLQIHENDSLSIDDLGLAARFIRHSLDKQPQRRIFVSCPDGIRFAPALILAFLLSLQKCDIDSSAAALDRRLPRYGSASTSLIHHPALRHFADKLNSDRLQFCQQSSHFIAASSNGLHGNTAPESEGWALIDKSDLC